VLVVSYTIPATDSVTKATFDFFYTDFNISPTNRAVFWTQGGAYQNVATDTTTLEMQLYDSSGAKIGSPTALALAGTQTAITDLYDVAVSSAVDFGSSFMAAYSTFDPATKATTIHFERFSSATGAALNGGVVYTVNDGTHHGITFGSYFTPQGQHTPAAGNDTLRGRSGDDMLVGGAGVNYLDGGAGADHLVGTGGTSYASYTDATVGVTVNLKTLANAGDAAGDTYGRN
jgi:hypothetical protein